MNNTYTDKVIIDNFKGKGKSIFLKGFDIKNIEIKGKVTVLDNCNFENFNFSGKAEVTNMSGEKLNIEGTITGKKIIAKEVNIFGEFNLESITGENIFLKGGDGHLKFIEADSISILGSTEEDKKKAINGIESIFKDNFLQKIQQFINFDKLKEHINSDNSYIYVDRIVGKNIKLKNVIANYVEGTNIEILEGCKIITVNKKD